MTGRARALAVAAAGVFVVSVVAAVVLLSSVFDRGSNDDPSALLDDCERTVDPQHSVARHWNEAILAAIRSDFPAPTVHARNLFHASAGMWDAWAAYEPEARGLFLDVDAPTPDGAAGGAREEAISFAAYRILVDRYLPSPGAEQAVTGLYDLMTALCYDRSFTATGDSSPASLGNRIAETILAATSDDGSNEAEDYVDPDYRPVNPPLLVDRSGTTMNDPNRWQPLELDVMVAQNGLPLDETVQTFVGPHWGYVEAFALPPADVDGLVIDPGGPPMLGDTETDADFKLAVNEVIRFGSTLDPGDDTTIDISPAVRGDTTLGTYEAAGRIDNPVTGRPYEPNVVRLSDYGRVVAEFWADGPSSETPPGHWNSIANVASDAMTDPLRIGGAGPEVDRLEWDVKLYLALNGAVHDAAIAAWGAKGHYDYARPISMIRYLGGLGQSSDPDGLGYHPDGLLLEDGLVEVVTAASSAPGERHETLAAHVDEIAVRSWRGAPDDPENEAGGVDWILAVDWVPYQLPTFVTPAFAGYVSGHSTFSRAGAEVLAAFTGSPYFPGGLAEWPIAAGSLEFEAGPVDDVVLQWATYADAADEAGLSRLYGGIHVRADDLDGRVMGAAVGQAAWDLAQQYYGPTGG